MMATDRLAPGAREPKVAATVPVAEPNDPWLVDTKLAPVGIVSLRLSPVALICPVLVIVSV